MGGGLSRPSATCLPCPNNQEDKLHLEALGVEFLPIKQLVDDESTDGESEPEKPLEIKKNKKSFRLI